MLRHQNGQGPNSCESGYHLAEMLRNWNSFPDRCSIQYAQIFAKEVVSCFPGFIDFPGDGMRHLVFRRAIRADPNVQSAPVADGTRVVSDGFQPEQPAFEGIVSFSVPRAVGFLSEFWFDPIDGLRADGDSADS